MKNINLFTSNSVMIEKKEYNSPLITEENNKRTQTVSPTKISINIERKDEYFKSTSKSIKKLTHSYILPAQRLKERKHLDVNFDDISRY